MVIMQPMTLYELLSLIISIAGFTTVIISIVFLVRQTREMAMQTKYVVESIKSSIYGSTAPQLLGADELFINCPELRPYFYSGKGITENDVLYNKAIAVAEYLLDFFESALLQIKHFPTVQVWPRKQWEAYIIDSFANSPVLCKYLNSTKDWYIDELVTLMETGKAHRQKKISDLNEQSWR